MAERNQAGYQGRPPDDLLRWKNALRRSSDRPGSSSLTVSRHTVFAHGRAAPLGVKKCIFVIAITA